MGASDTSPYGREHESVDLGATFGEEPRIPGAKPDGEAAHALAESVSPLSADRGGADPNNIGPGSVKMGMR